MSKKIGFPPEEIKSIAGLSSVIGLRMLGLSLMIPVFSVYAVGLPGSTPALAGLAFGIYGLTQAILQIPFGYISDRFGRKPVVIFGIAIFGVASVLAATTSNIYVLILARFFQGAGAIASACFAWIADLTHESRRNMAMAFMGISIGGGVVLGMILGPVIGGIMGARFLFWVAAALSAMAIIIIVLWLKEPENGNREHQSEFGVAPMELLKYSWKADLVKLDIAGFIMNAGMMATFFIVPIRISQHFATNELWRIYIPLCIMGGVAMMLSSRSADKGSPRKVIATSLASLVVAFVLLSFSGGLWLMLAGFALFFTAFSVLEATMPAAVSRLADPMHRGSVIGVYNFSQFSGTFVGGLAAGWLHDGKTGEVYLFAGLAIAALIGAALIASAKGIAGFADNG